jgi:TIR domain
LNAIILRFSIGCLYVCLADRRKSAANELQWHENARPSETRDGWGKCVDAGSIERDFFISYRSADQPWAEWIAWELEAAGYEVYRNGYMPRRLHRFLDHCTKLVFLRKVGGGYIFIHRLLLEHFAAMWEGREEKKGARALLSSGAVVAPS